MDKRAAARRSNVSARVAVREGVSIASVAIIAAE